MAWLIARGAVSSPWQRLGMRTHLKLRNVYSLYRIQTGENRHHVRASAVRNRFQQNLHGFLSSNNYANV
jgi:hypothetical protein